MFIPVILGTDKTTVSVATGQHEYHPIYLSIGNIHNRLRRAHRDGLVLVGFLPIPKGNNLLTYTFCLTYNLQVHDKTQSLIYFVTFAAASSTGV